MVGLDRDREAGKTTWPSFPSRTVTLYSYISLMSLNVENYAENVGGVYY